MFTVDYDDRIGIIRCRSEGFLTVADVHEYGRISADAVTRCRRKFGKVRMMVHSMESTVQSAEVMAAVADSNWEMTDPGDRMAVVVRTMLAKLQAARTFQSDRTKVFLTEAEALRWIEPG